jgi:predicted Zn-dependent peptidase
MKSLFTTLRHGVLLAASAALVSSAATAETITSLIPRRPEDIKFRPLDFQPPRAADSRRVLSNGVPVYMIPSKEFPLVNLVFSFRDATHIEEKPGLAQLTGAMIRRGGTTSKSATDLDEEFDFLAANATPGSLNALKSNFGEAFALYMDMLKHPGFQEDKVRVYKDEQIESMKQRNDDADDILRRTGNLLMWGDRHFEGRVVTRDQLEAITIDDMRRFHARVYHPGNLIIGVTGDFEPAEMMSTLEGALSGWAKGEAVPEPTDTEHRFTPGMYYVEKDIPQGKFWISQRGLKRDDPDAIPCEVMNDILGGGGFTSRLMKRIRSDEGLTYGVGSGFRNRVYYPGEFGVRTFSKNRTVALTAKMVYEELDKIRTGQVTQEELDVSKKSFIDTFPRTFESKVGTVNVFITDEWTKRPADYWQTYRDRVNAVTIADVQRVAQQHLDPSKMLMLVVGKWSEVAPGDPTEQRDSHKANMAMLPGGQEARRLPLLDPLTQQPLPMDEVKP